MMFEAIYLASAKDCLSFLAGLERGSRERTFLLEAKAENLASHNSSLFRASSPENSLFISVYYVCRFMFFSFSALVRFPAHSGSALMVAMELKTSHWPRQPSTFEWNWRHLWLRSSQRRSDRLHIVAESRSVSACFLPFQSFSIMFHLFQSFSLIPISGSFSDALGWWEDASNGMSS